jgi:hypothetical protein
MTLLHPTEHLSIHQPTLEDPDSLERTRYDLLATSERIRRGEAELSPEQLHHMASIALTLLAKDTKLPDFERFHTASQLLANFPKDYQPEGLEAILDESAEEAFPQNAAEELVAAKYAINRTGRDQPFALALEQAHTKLGLSTEEVIRTSQAAITKQRRDQRRQAALSEATGASDDWD